jgi:hypothetical protein
VANDYSANSEAAGDVNGDGYADILIGTTGGSYGNGSVYVVFGKATGWSSTPSTLNAAFLNGINGSELGNANINLSLTVAAGDVNGDGIVDVIVGSDYGLNPGGGSTFIYNGRASGWPATAYSLRGL